MKISIYSITNIKNNKKYIGMSQEVKTRLHKHLWALRKGTHDNKKLQNAFNKYGEESFKTEILETFETKNRMEGLQKEKFYIDKYDSYKKGYNMSNGFDGSTLYKWTEEQTSKMKNFMKGNSYGKGVKRTEEHKKIISKTHKGKNVSKETREKFIKELNPFYGKHHSEETLKKISDKVIKKRVMCIETGNIYGSIVECSKEMKIDRSNISKVCKGKQSNIKGYTFKYVD